MSDNDIDIEDDNSLFVHLNFDVKMVRIVDNILIPSQLKVRVELFPHEDADDSKLNLAFLKIKYWFDNVVSKCVVFCRFNEDAVQIVTNNGINRTGNLIMLTPDEPTDENLAVLFQSKMRALAGGWMEFGMIEVRSDNITGLEFTFIGDSDELLPSMSLWVGERNYFDKPWWQRDDASTLDVNPPEEADLTKTPAWAYKLDFLDPSAAGHKGEVIRPAFKPTVITGGKTEE